MIQFPGLDPCMYLQHGDVLEHAVQKNADGTPQRWRVNGKPADVEWQCALDGELTNIINRYTGDPRIYEDLAKLTRLVPKVQYPVAFRLPIKHGLKNTDQLYLPRDAVLIDWKGWAPILRKRKKEAEKLRKELDKNWAGFRRMMEKSSQYWLYWWHPCGGVITLSRTHTPDGLWVDKWLLQDREGFVLNEWSRYDDACLFATEKGYRRL